MATLETNKAQQRPKASLDRVLAEFTPQLLDALLLGVGYWLVTLFIWPEAQPAHYLYGLPIYLLSFYLSAYLTQLYGSWRGVQKIGLVLRLAFTCLLASILFTYLTHLLGYWALPPPAWMLGLALLSALLQSSVRLLLYRFVRELRQKGINLKSVLLIGNPGSCQHIKQSFNTAASGFRFVDELHTQANQEPPLQALQAAVKNQPLDEVWIALPLAEGQQVRSLHESLQATTVNVRYLPDLQDFRLLNHQITELGPLWSVDLSRTPLEGGARIIKSLEDYLLGCLFFLLSLPLMLVIALAIKLTSPGPVIFKQYRQGLDGRPFKIYKFRTMHTQPQAGFSQAQPNDPRVTPLGRLLRQTSMDELPQFFNVLQGRMSIVGPRPHVAEQNTYYNQVIDRYMQRHRVKPGITGWAQVNGLRGITQTDQVMRQRVEYDLYYINNWSLLFDIKIILLTLKQGLWNEKP